MSNYSTLGELFTATADSIRVKTEESDLIPAQSFPSEILNITTGVDTSDATATAADILYGKTAYISDGTKATGTIVSKSAETIVPSSVDQTISANSYLSGAQTIKAVSLVATANNMLNGTSACIESNGSTIASVNGTIPTYSWSLATCTGSKPSQTTISTKYTGNEITNGYTCPTNITMTGNDRGTEAGTYTAIYTPDSDYCWSDGDTQAQTVNLTIQPTYAVALVGDYGPKARYTTNGVSWYNCTIHDYCFDNIVSICFGNGVFVAVGHQYNMTYSTNAIDWYSGTSFSTEYNWAGVAYGNGVFSAVDKTYGYGATSSNGISWSRFSIPKYSWYDMCFGNGRFVAIGDRQSVAMYSSDGRNWTTVSAPSIYAPSIAYGNNTFVGVSLRGDVMYSADNGETWSSTTLCSSTDTESWFGGCFGAGKFIAVRFITNEYAYSTDGATWTKATLPSSGRWHTPRYLNGKFIIFADNSTNTLISTDGLTWTAASCNSTDVTDACGEL